jgi:AcrR family transcriptional regulator/DNA-binding MarR family transcriptional regulator
MGGVAAGGAVRSRAALTALASEQVADVQRARLLSGAMRAIDELGYTRATVTEITRRARVSRRTFYELFAGREECLVAVLDTTVKRVQAQIAHAELDALPWRERVRTGLWEILCFCEREPALARVCVVQSARGGQRTLERRAQILGELAAVIDEGRTVGTRAADCPALTAEGLVGAALSIVYGRLLLGAPEPLTGLLGDLMGMIVLPYLGPGAARQESTRPNPAPVSAPDVAVDEQGKSAQADGDPLRGIPMRLTYRTVRVLEAIAEQPGASNRLVRERSGISDEGQASKLLARLERYGLLQNSGEGHTKGEPNQWSLTGRGTQLTQTIRAHAHNNREVAQ